MSEWALCHLSKQAREYVRENAFREGAANMTSRSFCTWVNTVLLPNSILESGAPHRISVEVARKWLHSMGFEVKPLTKGIYIDGHERDDVVEVRDEFLNKMTSLGFLHSPSEEMACLLPNVELSPDHDKTKVAIMPMTMREQCGRMIQCKFSNPRGEGLELWYQIL